jgi:hypothetical protein
MANRPMATDSQDLARLRHRFQGLKLVLVATISVVNAGWYRCCRLASTTRSVRPAALRPRLARSSPLNVLLPLALLAFVPGCSRRRHP